MKRSRLVPSKGAGGEADRYHQHKMGDTVGFLVGAVCLITTTHSAVLLVNASRAI